MGRKAALTIFLLTSVAPAEAEWKVDSFKDRMTDRVLKSATTPAKEADGRISATLRVSCMNGTPMIFTDLAGGGLTPGRVNGVYRLDDGGMSPTYLSVTSDPRQVAFVGTPPNVLSGKKRMRLQLSPYGRSAMVFEFDVAGFDKVLPTIKCG